MGHFHRALPGPDIADFYSFVLVEFWLTSRPINRLDKLHNHGLSQGCSPI